MKVAWFHRFGGPQVLVCEETARPAPGPGEAFAKSLQCLKRNGVIVTVGAHAGEVVSFDIIAFFRRELRLCGSKNAPVTELRAVMNLVAEGKLKPVIHRSFPLAEAAEAHRVVDSRQIFGKVLLLP